MAKNYRRHLMALGYGPVFEMVEDAGARLAIEPAGGHFKARITRGEVTRTFPLPSSPSDVKGIHHCVRRVKKILRDMPAP